MTARSSASPTAASPSTHMRKGSAAGRASAGPLGELGEVVDERCFQRRLRHILRDGHRVPISMQTHSTGAREGRHSEECRRRCRLSVAADATQTSSHHRSP